MKLIGTKPMTKRDKRRLIVRIIEDVIVIAGIVLFVVVCNAIAQWAFRVLGVA